MFIPDKQSQPCITLPTLPSLSHSLDISLTRNTQNKRPSAQSLLKQLEEEKKRLSQLENSDMQSRVRQEKAWQSSLAKAQGEKVKDNPALLRKSIRKEKQRKVWTTIDRHFCDSYSAMQCFLISCPFLGQKREKVGR